VMRTVLKCAVVAAVGLALLTACEKDDTGKQAVAPQQRSPGELVKEYEAKVKADAELSEYEIEASVSEDKVMKITGKVPGAELKQKAERLARTVAGVKSIDNSLSLSGEAMKEMELSDRRLRRELEKKIDADSELSMYPIRVDVDDGRATVSGCVSNDDERDKTTELAETVTGLSEVRNELRLSDEMAEEFMAKVEADSELRDFDLGVEMTRGNHMTITGRLPNKDYRKKAEELAETVSGVGKVENKIATSEEMAVPPLKAMSDEKLRRELEEKIAADDDLRDTDITVEVQNGEAIIRGTVPDSKVRRKIEKLARTVTGITDIENKVELQPEKEVATRPPWPRASARFVNDLL